MTDIDALMSYTSRGTFPVYLLLPFESRGIGFVDSVHGVCEFSIAKIVLLRKKRFKGEEHILSRRWAKAWGALFFVEARRPSGFARLTAPLCERAPQSGALLYRSCRDGHSRNQSTYSILVA